MIISFPSNFHICIHFHLRCLVEMAQNALTSIACGEWWLQLNFNVSFWIMTKKPNMTASNCFIQLLQAIQHNGVWYFSRYDECLWIRWLINWLIMISSAKQKNELWKSIEKKWDSHIIFIKSTMCDERETYGRPTAHLIWQIIKQNTTAID